METLFRIKPLEWRKQDKPRHVEGGNRISHATWRADTAFGYYMVMDDPGNGNKGHSAWHLLPGTLFEESSKNVAAAKAACQAHHHENIMRDLMPVESQQVVMGKAVEPYLGDQYPWKDEKEFNEWFRQVLKSEKGPSVQDFNKHPNG